MPLCGNSKAEPALLRGASPEGVNDAGRNGGLAVVAVEALETDTAVSILEGDERSVRRFRSAQQRVQAWMTLPGVHGSNRRFGPSIIHRGRCADRLTGIWSFFSAGGPLAPPDRRRLQFQQKRRTERTAACVDRFPPHVTVAELPSLEGCVRDRRIGPGQGFLRHDIEDEVAAGYGVTDDDVADMSSHAWTDTPTSAKMQLPLLDCGKS
jgi:hypothetical protein